MRARISPRVSIVLSPGDAAQRLAMSVASAIGSGEASGASFEVVVGLADADGPTREVAETLQHPRLRLSAGSAGATRAAAELAWGEIVMPMKGGDLLAPSYVGRLAETLDQGDGDVVARPAACMTYGGSPALRIQTSLGGEAADRGRLMFGAPFAPPLAAARSLLVRLSARRWSLEDDWAWTAETSAQGIRHPVAEGAVYVAWSPPAVTPIALRPALGSPVSPAASPMVEPASEAETAAVLYARAAHARLGGAEASLRVDAQRLDQLESRTGELHAALAAALDEADRARRVTEALQASTSWKATAPLRSLVSRLRPGGR